MPTSLLEGHSLLTIDIGATTTRATYFDVVEERYRFIGMGQSPTTVGAPYRDAGIGVRQAITHLQALVGRVFLDEEQRLIMPSMPEEGAGVDMVAGTLSAGPSLKVALVGLLEDVSLGSAQQLMRSTYGRVVETIGLNDRRKPSEQIDSLTLHAPDLVIITGGTENGASRSVQKLLEMIGLACYVTPSEKRPAILYAGNSTLVEDVKKSLRGLAPALHISPNIRPSLDVEDTNPAQRALATLFIESRRRQLNGVDELHGWSSGTMLPNAYARGRMIRFLGNLLQDNARGVLGVDVGASAVTVAASFEGGLNLSVLPQFGLGEPLANLLRYTSLPDILRWLPIEIPESVVRDYLLHKALYPETLPATTEDLAIEESLARQVLQLAVRAAGRSFPRKFAPPSGLLPFFEPIVASGSVFANAPTHGQSLLMLLDALQPAGVTRLVLDKNDLLPALGVAAERSAILPVHVIESWPFTTLSTVISPISAANYGAPIVRARIIHPDGNESKAEVKQGGFEVLPLTSGRLTRIELQPLGRTDLGQGYGRPFKFEAAGGIIGVVIDARGRPLQLPPDPVRRRELIKKWLWTVGG